VRKPVGEPVETFVDRQIRAAREAGELDNLPGGGMTARGWLTALET